MLNLTADWRLMTFVALTAAVTSLLFGLIPALRVSHVDPLAAMRQASRGVTVDRHRARFQRALVIGQIAVSLVLVVSALLFVRSFQKLTRVETGLDVDRTAVVWAMDRQADSSSIEQRVQFQQRLADEIRSVPGVVAAASTTLIPLSGASWWHFFRIPSLAGNEQQGSRFTYVSPGYFDTLGIPIRSGRDFGRFDNAQSRRVMLVNESFVRTHLGGSSPIGVSIRTIAEAGYPEVTYEIIGVVGNTKYSDLREEMPPIAYVPIAQDPGLMPWAPVVIRAGTSVAGLAATITKRVQQLSPSLVVQFTELRTQVGEHLIAERTTAWLAGAFGVLAIVMVTVGLYGLIAYLAVSRRQEIGIRLSLGSTRAQIVRLILRDSVWLLTLGLIVGVPAAAVAMRAAGTLLFDLSPTDLTTLAASASLLGAAAGLAGAVPAWRAARVDPQVALRCD
jgi:predicted permease